MSLSPSRLEIKKGIFPSPTVSDGDVEGEPSGRRWPLAAIGQESRREQRQTQPESCADEQRDDNSPLHPEQQRSGKQPNCER